MASRHEETHDRTRLQGLGEPYRIVRIIQSRSGIATNHMKGPYNLFKQWRGFKRLIGPWVTKVLHFRKSLKTDKSDVIPLCSNNNQTAKDNISLHSMTRKWKTKFISMFPLPDIENSGIDWLGRLVCPSCPAHSVGERTATRGRN